MIINIRNLNKIIKLDNYLLSFQKDIIVIVANFLYINIIDIINYFYQFNIYSEDRYKFIIIFYHNQE